MEEVPLCWRLSAQSQMLHLSRSSDHGIITDKHRTENEYSARRKMAMRKISYRSSPALECTQPEKNYIYSQWSIQKLNFNSIKASLPVGHAFVAVIVSLCFSDSSSLNVNRAGAQTFSRARRNILIQPHKREEKPWQEQVEVGWVPAASSATHTSMQMAANGNGFLNFSIGSCDGNELILAWAHRGARKWTKPYETQTPRRSNTFSCWQQLITPSRSSVCRLLKPLSLLCSATCANSLACVLMAHS